MAKTDTWGRLIEQASPDLGTTAVRGRLTYRVPVEAVLTGVYANPSGFTKGASYLEAFAQPLYVPSEHLDFTIGQRVGGGTRTYTQDELAAGAADMAAAASFLKSHGDAEALLASSGWKHRANIRMVEIEAYSLIWCGRGEEAHAVFQGINAMRLSYDWEREVAKRAQHVQALLGSSAAEARRELVEFRDQTIQHLKLPATATPATEWSAQPGSAL